MSDFLQEYEALKAARAEAESAHLMERCCERCVEAYESAGQLVSRDKSGEQAAALMEQCRSCGGYLVDGEIWDLRVDL